MTTVLHHPDPTDAPTRPHRGIPGRRTALAGGVLVVLLALLAGALVVHRVRTADLRHSYLGPDGWPSVGQAAYRAGREVHVGPGQTPAPIASLAKVMTAYVVLQEQPLHGTEAGPSYPVTAADVRDYERRRDRDESVVRVAAGERLTERQALAALLLPSANNVAVLLARHVAGSTAEFVARMNATARRLGMAQTRYTDPSGFAATTVSTAGDQLILAAAVAGNGVFGDLVSRTSYRLPVVGVVHTTDALLGHDGFVGTKTGSDDAAGGCFLFRSWRVVRGQLTDVLGVVLGQRGRHDITAGLQATRQLADRLGPPAAG